MCHIRSPQTKGKVERLVRYVKENFLPGRRFEDLICNKAPFQYTCISQKCKAWAVPITPQNVEYGIAIR